MNNPLLYIANKFNLSPPYANLFIRMVTVIFIIYIITILLTIWYYFIGGDFTALLGGLIVNLFTIIIILVFIEKISDVLKIWFELDMKRYKNEQLEKLRDKKDSE